MPVSRAVGFLRSFLTMVGVITLIGFIVWVAQTQTGFLDPVIAMATLWLAQANAFLDTSMMTGISAGMIILSLLVLVLPLLMKGINKPQYTTAVRRGVVSSLVFFVSQILYTWAELQGRGLLIVSMIVVLILSFVIIEFLSRLLKAEHEAAFRTDMLASMASGLVSGIVLKLIEVLVRGV